MTSVEAGTYRNSVLRGFLIQAESADSFADLFFLVIFLMLLMLELLSFDNRSIQELELAS
jgi:hypothetical protein